MIIGAALFLLVVIGVWILVWIKAEDLTFSQESHLKRRKDTNFGTDKKVDEKSIDTSKSE